MPTVPLPIVPPTIIEPIPPIPPHEKATTRSSASSKQHVRRQPEHE